MTISWGENVRRQFKRKTAGLFTEILLPDLDTVGGLFAGGQPGHFYEQPCGRDDTQHLNTIRNHFDYFKHVQHFIASLRIVRIRTVGKYLSDMPGIQPVTGITHHKHQPG